jgi:hypothetical protein
MWTFPLVCPYMKSVSFLIILFLMIACNRQTELQKRCAVIRGTPQAAFPAGIDKKWKLIKELREIKDPALPDSVKSIFSSIDTTIRGYDEYRLALLNLLLQPDSRNSLKIMAEVFNENYIDDPSCSQVLTRFLMDESLWGQMIISYYTKRNNVDYSKVLKNIDVMFPGLAQILGKRPFTDDPILTLLKFGLDAGVLDKAKLASSKNELVRYHHHLELAGDTRKNAILVEILKTFKGDETVDKIIESGIR